MKIEITYEKAINAVNMVQQLHDKTGAFFRSQGLDPNSNSIAAKELQALSALNLCLRHTGQEVSFNGVCCCCRPFDCVYKNYHRASSKHCAVDNYPFSSRSQRTVIMAT